MRLMIISCLVASLFFATLTFANPPQGGKSQGHGPCHEIRKACLAAGFVEGDWKQGYGLWRDCINPTMQGLTSVPGATKPLPSVDPSLVSACKAKNPNFGKGKDGSK